MAIIELLDEKYPDVPLLPNDSMTRYRSREIAHIIGTGIQPVQNLSVLKKVVAWTNEEMIRNFMTHIMRHFYDSFNMTHLLNRLKSLLIN